MEGVEASSAPVKAKKARRAPRAKASGSEASSASVVLGSNVHYDEQGRMLCSSSVKVCNSRQVVGYGFCKLHILEDKTAPFKQCEAMTRGRQCTLVVSLSDNSKFCGIHASAEKRAAAISASTPSLATPEPEPALVAPSSVHVVPKTSATPSVSAFVDCEVNEGLESEEEDWRFELEEIGPQAPLVRLSALFPPVLYLTKQGARSELAKEEEERQELGHPQFSRDSYLQARREKLLRSVRYYRMRVGQLQLAYESKVREGVRERAREEARLKNEGSCLSLDAQRRLRTIEQLYRRRYEEEQKRREVGAGGAAGGEESQLAGVSSLLGAQDAAYSTSSPRSTPVHNIKGEREAQTTPQRRGKSTSAATATALSSSPHSAEPIVKATRITPIGPCKQEGCTESALPLATFCYRHILLDTRQKFFVSCSFDSSMMTDEARELGVRDQKCDFPIVRGSSPLLCAFHADLLHSDTPDATSHANEGEEGEDGEDQAVDIEEVFS